MDARIASLDLPPEASATLEEEKVYLAGAEVPEGVGEEEAAAIERAIDESFVAGFRMVMLIAAGLAIASAVAAAILIEGKGSPQKVAESKRTEAGTAPA
jgi:hypothetical protein